MKRLVSATFILFLFYGTASSQSCLPEGISFNTQEKIDNFQTNYPGCTEIEGDVGISGNHITNLNGLNVLTSIGGDLEMNNINALTSLTGLDNVTSIGGVLRIYSNDALTNLTGLDNVTSIGGGLFIEINYALNSTTGLDNVTSIGGGLSIGSNSALISLTGLDNVTSIGGDLTIYLNFALISLTGLDNVTSIEGGLYIARNTNLTSLTGLDNMSSIGDFFKIEINNALTSLTGLNNVTSIGGGLFIKSNNALNSITGLDNVTSIGGGLRITGNDALTSLTGLDNIDAASIDYSDIINNISLSTCEVQSICDYLTSPTGIIWIFNNAPGCNSNEEVEEACELSVEGINPNEEISISPNPANKQITISSKNGTAIEEVIIYNQTGQIVLLEKLENNIIDISQLQLGMYVIEVVSGQRKIREKLIIE